MTVMTLSRLIPCTALMAIMASPGLATPQFALSEKLQQDAMSCVGEAVQICPELMTVEDHGVSCMVGKRSQFSPRCRIVYDQVAHVLKR